MDRLRNIKKPLPKCCIIHSNWLKAFNCFLLFDTKVKICVFTLILFWHFIPIFIPTFFFLFPHLSYFYVPFTLTCSAWTVLLLKLTVLGSPKIIYYISWKNTWLGKASVKQHTTTNLGIGCWVDSRVLFKYKIRIIWFDLMGS